MPSTLSNQFNSAFTLFLSLLVEAFPFLLLGVLFSGALLFFVDEQKLLARMPKNPLLGALAGSLVGFLFPVCECGNVPVARRLIMQGVPAPVTIGFLLAAPTINPIVIWSTWTAFRDQPEIVLLRVVFSLIIATIVGWVFSVQTDIRPLLQPALANLIPPSQSKTANLSLPVEETSILLQSGTYLMGRPGELQRLDTPTGQINYSFNNPYSPTLINPQKLRLFLDNTIQELRELGAVLILGSAIAAAIQVLVPREIILSLGAGSVTSILAMMILACIVSICSTVDSFFALSFSSAFTGSSLVAFLVFGPMVDIKGIGLMLSIFKPRPIIYMFTLAAQLTFLLTLIANFYLN